MSTPLSSRRRRLRWTLAALSGVFITGICIGLLVYAKSRPTAYRPDEQSDDITSGLAKNLPAEAPRPKLADVTRTAGLGGFRNFAGPRTSQLPEDMGPGLAWGDFDNDGDDDLLLVAAGGSLNVPRDQLDPCALYENLGDGTFRQVQRFPVIRIRGMAAAWGDYDADGFLDLAMTGYDQILLLRNSGGTGEFVTDERLPSMPGFWSGAAWGDYDNDRRLDLYVCNYVQYVGHEEDRSKLSQQIGTAVPYTLNPSSYPPGFNALFHQLPDGSFTNVAAELNVQNPIGRSLGGVWHDFDQDGWLDLYVANDVSDNVLYRNVGGRFEDISHPAWVADYRSAMGMATGDFDRDGDDDLFVSHWVAQENAFYENLLVNRNARPQAPSQPGNATQRPPVVFIDVADQKGLGQISLPFVGWGTEFVDLDQDGWLDLLVANGNTLELEGSSPRQLKPQEMFLFWNQKGQCFHNLAQLSPALREQRSSRGLACADYDRDGDADCAIADLGEGVRLFRNDMAMGHWLKVRLRSRNAEGVANGFGEGSTAVAWVRGVPLRRTVTGVSYLSQSSHTLHWGIGDATRIAQLEVRWHAGGTNIFENLDADTFYEIREGDPSPRILAPSTSGLVANPSRSLRQTPVAGRPSPNDRERLTRFWSVQRNAMDALKVEKDSAKAIRLFREAIALNPEHEDSRYYLGLCLAQEGDPAAALQVLGELRSLNPQSHRAWQQWGMVRAASARSDEDLAAAEQALERAHQLNPEETGALLALGEVALLRGRQQSAGERLAAATQTNPKAAGGFFLQGYLAWKAGEIGAARQLLERARAALGPDWVPAGSTGEGDVKRKQHLDNALLASSWETWNLAIDCDQAFRPLEQRLAASRQPFDSE